MIFAHRPQSVFPPRPLSLTTPRGAVPASILLSPEEEEDGRRSLTRWRLPGRREKRLRCPIPRSLTDFPRRLTVFESPSPGCSSASPYLAVFPLRSARFREISGGGGGGAFTFLLHHRRTSRFLGSGAPLSSRNYFPPPGFWRRRGPCPLPLSGWCRCVVAPLAAIFDSPFIGLFGRHKMAAPMDSLSSASPGRL